MELIKADIKFDFLGKAKFALTLSLCLLAASIWVWFDTGEDKYGIDYKGGHEIVVRMEKTVSSDDIRGALSAGGLEGALVQSFEAESQEYSIRVGGDAESASVKEGVDAALLSLEGHEVIKTDFVGPTIGQELRTKALWAVCIALIVMLLYISIRFEFAFALGAVAALFHDVVICMGIYLGLGNTISVATLAAALTIVGYSVNDTIIVYDRMREEATRRQEFDLVDLMNGSISQTLSRTVITSLLTLFAAAALLIFGGGAIRELSVFLVAGVISGTYSTIFIASPVALAWERFQAKRAPVVAEAP